MVGMMENTDGIAMSSVEAVLGLRLKSPRKTANWMDQSATRRMGISSAATSRLGMLIELRMRRTATEMMDCLSERTENQAAQYTNGESPTMNSEWLSPLYPSSATPAVRPWSERNMRKVQ
eukprot:3887967-Rhodomonas_salina.1